MQVMERNQKEYTMRIVYCGMLIGLSAVGAFIKIQGTIAFDSLPGFFAALFLGPGPGAIVGGLGHLLTAITSGFPLTIPMHLVVALEMMVFVYAFGWVYQKSNGILASILAIILNGPVAALIAVPTSVLFGSPFSGWALFSVVIVPLTLASAANVIVAYGVYKILKGKFN